VDLNLVKTLKIKKVQWMTSLLSAKTRNAPIGAIIKVFGDYLGHGACVFPKLTPKALNCIFWQHSNFGQFTMNGVFIFFL